MIWSKMRYSLDDDDDDDDDDARCYKMMKDETSQKKKKNNEAWYWCIAKAATYQALHPGIPSDYIRVLVTWSLSCSPFRAK